MLLNKATTVSPESIEDFRKSLIAKGRSSRTAKAYCTDLSVLLADMNRTEIPAAEFQQVGMEWLTRYREIVAAKTTGRRLTALKQFTAWAGWGILFQDYSAPTPLKGTPHPLPEGIEGVKRMIEVAKTEQHKALVALCGLCGCRIAEALAVEAKDFDLHAKTLLIRGKGSKERVVPVSSYAWEVLSGPVLRAFCEGRPVVNLQDRAAREQITKLGERAGLRRKVASHDLRATFATEVYNKTLDQRLVQELLGHASGDTTQIYIEVNDAKKRNGVEL